MVEFKQSRQSLTESDVAAAEGELGVGFPPDYRAFMLHTNGGVPEPCTFADPTGSDDEPSVVEAIYSIGDPQRQRDHLDLVAMNQHFRSELHLPTEWLAIGLFDEMDVLLLSLSEEDFGALNLWSFIEGGYEEDRVDRLANSFSDFLNMLR